MVVLSPAELALEQRRFEVMAPVTARRMELHLAEPLQKGVRGTETTERQPIDWRAIAVHK